jgi:hypothetical protein
MHATIPVPTTVVAELVPTGACHVIATLDPLNHKKTLLALLIAEISLQQPNHLSLTPSKLWMGFIHAGGAIFYQTLLAQQVILAFQATQLLTAVRAKFVASALYRVKIFLYFEVSLLQLGRQGIIDFSFCMNGTDTTLPRALNITKLVF